MTEKIILVEVILKSTKDIDHLYSKGSDLKNNLQELEELTSTAGGQVVSKLMQYVNRWNPSTLIGSGKIEEIQSLLEEESAHKIIIDHHLSGIQQRNLEQILKVPVLDRNTFNFRYFCTKSTH